MFVFLIPLLIGFAFNSGSTFTSIYSSWLGVRGGRIVSIILRDVLGIPVWAIGYVIAASTPSALLFSPTMIISMLSWLIVLVGAAIILTGLITIRWRAAAPSAQDTLVTQGIYSYIRHPLYSGMTLELVGLFLWVPTVIVFVACVLGCVWVMVQARLEEIDLLRRLPTYKEYMQRVPRFIPRLKQQ